MSTHEASGAGPSCLNQELRRVVYKYHGTSHRTRRRSAPHGQQFSPMSRLLHSRGVRAGFELPSGAREHRSESVHLCLTHFSVCQTLPCMRSLQRALTSFAALFLFAVLLPAQTAPEVSLAVTGDVPTPLTLNATDWAAMPRVSVDVPNADGGKDTYEGVALQEILKKAGIPFGHEMRGKALAGYLIAEAKDGYAVVFSLGELDPDLGAAKIVGADKRGGKPLFAYQGPSRLVVPADKEGARSVRMLEKLEFVKLRN